MIRKKPPRRLVLVGFMASGKSRVGLEVARRLGWEFRDMDRWIEQRTSLSVAEIFRRHGEAAFREEERCLAEEWASQSRLVVAAGGGAFAEPATRKALRRGAATVWLRCDLPTVLSRLRPDGSRPLAASRATIERLFDLREPSYRLADFTVEASQGSPEALASDVLHRVFAGRPPLPAKTTEP